MTTTPTDRIYHEVRGRQSYGARLLGPNPRTKFEREWCHRRQSLRGVRGLWVEIGPEPGWYETSTLTAAGYNMTRNYWAYEGYPNEPLEPIGLDWMLRAVTGPAPGQLGAFYGYRCPCGSLLDRYTPQGWPRCETHWQTMPDGPPAEPARKRKAA